MRTGTSFENLWHSRKHHALYTAFAPDVVQAVGAGKPEFDYEKEKKSYTYVNCHPFERISGNCYGADEEGDHIKEVPVKAVSGGVLSFDGNVGIHRRHGGVSGKER